MALHPTLVTLSGFGGPVSLRAMVDHLDRLGVSDYWVRFSPPPGMTVHAAATLGLPRWEASARLDGMTHVAEPRYATAAAATAAVWQSVVNNATCPYCHRRLVSIPPGGPECRPMVAAFGGAAWIRQPCRPERLQ